MPGLFGIVPLQDATASPADGAGFLDRMARVLRHDTAERLDTYSPANNSVRIARIGLSHVHPVPWPADNPKSASLVGGVLHPPFPAAPDPGSSLTDRAAASRGFFAIALHDGRRTLIAVDRHASLPVYYATADGSLLFAPEIKALVQHPAVARNVDPAALANFLVSGFLPLDLTLFQSVRRLRGGQALLVEDGRLRVAEYWRYRPASRAGARSRRELEEAVGELVEQAAARNLGDPEKTVLFLSGGFDSRAILGGCVKAMGGDKARLQTVTWGKDRGPDDSDVAVAQLLAGELGLKHWFIQRSTDDYEPRFREVNHLLDAQSEIAAFHPHEYVIMKELRARGFERVLRGDECFGYSYHVSSFTGAMNVVWMHRLRDAVNGRDFLRPDVHARLCDASDDVIDKARAEVHGMSADDAKDYLYFTTRLQGYLNTASYYKRCLLDQRNVFVDEAFLDLLEEIPSKWRIDKNLFCSAVRRCFPDLYRYPMARLHNLEDWAELLGKDSPVRTFALRELSDTRSGVWDWFDREACLRFVEGLGRSDGPKRRSLKSRLTSLFLKLPHWMQAPVQAWKASRPAFRMPPEYVLLRILTLKDWHDTFCPTP